jgi:hypothetical protein
MAVCEGLVSSVINLPRVLLPSVSIAVMGARCRQRPAAVFFAAPTLLAGLP